MLDMRIIIAAGRRRQTEADQALLNERLDDIHEVCRGRNTILIPTILPDGVVAMTHRLADKRGCMMEFFPFDYLKHPENHRPRSGPAPGTARCARRRAEP